MPSTLVPRETIPELASRIESREMFRVLQRLIRAKFLRAGPDLDEETVVALQQLSDLGLADPGYEGPTHGKPFIWLANHNGTRVVQYIEETPAYRSRFEFELPMTPRGRTALATLVESEQEAVLAKVASLQAIDPACWPPDEVVPLGQDQRVYLLKVSPDLRVFLQVREDRQIELADIMRADTLSRFLESIRMGSKVG